MCKLLLHSKFCLKLSADLFKFFVNSKLSLIIIMLTINQAAKDSAKKINLGGSASFFQSPQLSTPSVYIIYSNRNGRFYKTRGTSKIKMVGVNS